MNDRRKRLVMIVAVVASLALVGTAAAASPTFGQRQAQAAAKSYLKFGSFSRAGLIHQLDSPYGSDFSRADAVWGATHAGANWNAEAVEAAKAYLKFSSFSRAGLIRQLTSPYGDKFTRAQAVYAVNRVYR